MAYAFSAFAARYPDVSPHNLNLATPVYFHCHTWTRAVGLSALDEARFECTAVVNFDLSKVAIEHVYDDPDGNCVAVTPASVAMVRVHETGGARVYLSHDSESKGRVVDCDEEAIAEIAAAHVDLPGRGKPFAVDARGLLQSFLEAAIEAYPDIPREQVVYGGGPSMLVSCETAPGADGLSPIDRELALCTASATLMDESVMVEYRYIEDGGCMIGQSSDLLLVKIGQDGRTEVEHRESQGGGRAQGVECDGKFYNSPLPMLTSPAEGRPGSTH
jgi:hypothetical protein